MDTTALQGNLEEMKQSKTQFDIYMSVHRHIIPNYSQQDKTVLVKIYKHCKNK
jgi:hypothetical protein